MAEQFSLNQFAWDRRHVDRDKGAGFAVPQIMDRFGHQFLARAAFARNQDRQVIAQKPCDHAVNILHRGASSNHRKIGLGERLERILRR